MELFDHPGNLGSTRGSLFTVHHADWPAYPQGDDFRTPLLQLTAFPPGTEFVVVDDIDRSLLLVASAHGLKPHKPFDGKKNFHIAVWHEDLIELGKRGFVEGITPATEFEWHQEQWNRIVAAAPEGAVIGFKDSDGGFVPIDGPSPQDYEDELPGKDFVICPNERLHITDLGRRFLLSQLKEEIINLRDAIGDRVAQVFQLGYYDTCIREACVQLEHEIRTRAISDAWGDRLVELYVDKIRADQTFLESFVRTIRQELRSVFKFIRNDYMHNLVEADEASAHAILFRVARIRSSLGLSHG